MTAARQPITIPTTASVLIPDFPVATAGLFPSAPDTPSGVVLGPDCMPGSKALVEGNAALLAEPTAILLSPCWTGRAAEAEEDGEERNRDDEASDAAEASDAEEETVAVEAEASVAWEGAFPPLRVGELAEEIFLVVVVLAEGGFTGC